MPSDGDQEITKRSKVSIFDHWITVFDDFAINARSQKIAGDPCDQRWDTVHVCCTRPPARTPNLDFGVCTVCGGYSSTKGLAIKAIFIKKRGGRYLSFAAVIKKKVRNRQRVRSLSLTPEGRSSTSY